MLQSVEHTKAGSVRVVAKPIRFSATETGTTLPPPVFAEHTDDVLRDVLGLPAGEIAALRAKGAIR